jgi:hypothetical protein
VNGHVYLTLAPQPVLHAVKARALSNRIKPGWQERAACGNTTDPDVWFPERSVPRRHLAEVLSLCEGCPVRRSCLAAGLLGHEYGIWGGTTEAERDAALEDLTARTRTDDVLDRLLGVPAARGAA